MNRYGDVDLGNKKLPPVGGYWSEDLVSLEDALKPIESSINELERSIKMAKKHCTFPSEHGLTRDESAAVYLYTMEGGKNSFYKILNEALRSENRPALRSWFPFLKLFDVALNKLPTVKGIIWRGVSGDISEQFKRDQLLTWWSISSCSKEKDVIKDFLGSNASSTLFMIEAVNAKDVSRYTYFPNENEVILGLGTELRVNGNTLKHHGGLSIVHLVELSDDDVDELPKVIAKMDLKPKISEKDASGIEQPAMASPSVSVAQTSKESSSSGTGQSTSTISSIPLAQAIVKETPAASSNKNTSTYIKAPLQSMPACPRCGRHDRVYYYSDYRLRTRRYSAADRRAFDDRRDYPNYTDRCDVLSDAAARLAALDTDAADLAAYRADDGDTDAADAADFLYADGYIGDRTKFCLFKLTGFDRSMICDYKH